MIQPLASGWSGCSFQGFPSRSMQQRKQIRPALEPYTFNTKPYHNAGASGSPHILHKLLWPPKRGELASPVCTSPCGTASSILSKTYHRQRPPENKAPTGRRERSPATRDELALALREQGNTTDVGIQYVLFPSAWTAAALQPLPVPG
jgi:hypothetical protein